MLPKVQIIEILHFYRIDVLILGLIDKLLAMLVKKLTAIHEAMPRIIAAIDEKSAAVRLARSNKLSGQARTNNK